MAIGGEDQNISFFGVRKLGLYSGRREEKKRKIRRNPGLEIDIGLFGTSLLVWNVWKFPIC